MWKGLSLPYYGECTDKRLADVVTDKPVDRHGGFLVKWNDAMDAIGIKDPMTRTWWEMMVKEPPRMIIIGKEFCKVEFLFDPDAEDL